MTIKTKLFANMLITVAGILIIAGFSLAGMRFVQSKLSVLTEKSTPYQLKTIELQRAVQEHTSNLLKAVGATTPQELTATQGDLDASLAEVGKISAELSSFKGAGLAEGSEKQHLDELGVITADLVRTVAEKLKAREEAREADSLMKGKLQQIDLKLKEMDGAMKKLQKGSMAQLSNSNDSVKRIGQRVKSIQATMNAINDVKISLLEMAAAENKAGLTVARTHYTVASRWVTTGALAKAEKDSAAVRSLVDGINEITKQVTGAGGLIQTKSTLLSAPTEELKKQFDVTHAAAMQKLAQMTVVMGDLVEGAAAVNTNENQRFDDSLKGSAAASAIMAMNSDLVAIGGDIRSLTKELFEAEDVQTLAATKARLERQFLQADALQGRLKSVGGGQVRQLRDVLLSLQEIRGLLLAQHGVVVKLQHSLEVTRQARALNEKLKGVVAAQREEGKKGMTTAQQEQSEAVKSVNTVFRTNIATVSIIGLAVLVLGVLFSLVLSRSITAPIKELSDMAERFGNGDFSAQLDDRRKDEFGKLAGHFNGATLKLREITGGLRQAINNLAEHSKYLTGTAEELNRGAQQQANQVVQAATAMTEMNQTIHEVAASAGSAAQATSNSLGIASGGKETVGKTVQGMEDIAKAVRDTAQSISQLGTSSGRIGEIVNTINEIADQTNLLALNAAIEAARAGEAGMGFAVVADEVRRLAERTTQATGEIGSMIREIQSQTQQSVVSMQDGTRRVEQGVALASEAQEALERIVDASGQGADMVTRIATAAEQQSATASEVSASMERIEDITRATESATGEINRSARELSGLAEELNRMAGWFRS